MKGNSPLSTWAGNGAGCLKRGQEVAGSAGREGRLGEGPSSAWQGVLSPAAPSHQTLPSPGSPCGQSRHLGNGQRGQATACPPQGSQHSPLLLTPEKTLSMSITGGEGRGRRDGGEGESVPLGRKHWKDGRTVCTLAPCSHSLSLSLFSQSILVQLGT